MFGALTAVVVALIIGSPASLDAQQREKVATIASYSIFQSAMILSGFMPDDLTVPIVMAGSLLQTAPLWSASVPEGALYSALTAASFGGFFLAPKDSVVRDSLGNAGIKTALWSNYRTYAAYREKADPTWQSERFVDLVAAPYDWEDMNTAAVWTVLAAGAVASVSFNLLSAEPGEAVWDTGNAYLGDLQVAPVLGVAAAFGIGLINNTLTGATEEAMFRGVQYEVLQNRLGRGSARWIDSLVFAGIHVPGDIFRGEDFASIALTFAYRTLVTLGLQWAYDSAGLQSAAGLHAWLNVISEVSEYLTTAGLSRTERSADVSISPLSLRFPLTY
jgi:membrane protease YdiL (CAAX protease family)